LHPVEIQHLGLAGPKNLVPPGGPNIFDTGCVQLMTDPTGHFLYVLTDEAANGTSPTGNALHVLQIGADGMLTEPVGAPVLPLPTAANPMGVVTLQIEGQEDEGHGHSAAGNKKPAPAPHAASAAGNQILVSAPHATSTGGDGRPHTTSTGGGSY